MSLVRQVVREELRVVVDEIRKLRGARPLSLADAARELGVSVRTLRRKIKEGEIDATHIGRRVFIDLATLFPDPGDVARLAHRARWGGR